MRPEFPRRLSPVPAKGNAILLVQPAKTAELNAWLAARLDAA
jgi:hypothetical protein